MSSSVLKGPLLASSVDYRSYTVAQIYRLINKAIVQSTTLVNSSDAQSFYAPEKKIN